MYICIIDVRAQKRQTVFLTSSWSGPKILKKEYNFENKIFKNQGKMISAYHKEFLKCAYIVDAYKRERGIPNLTFG